MRFDKKLKGFVCAVMALLLMVLSSESVSAADLKEQERQELIRAGYKEVTAQEIEKIGIDYYNNRNRYSEPVKVFCEGPLNSTLEQLYTTSVNCYDSYEECAMAAFIQYKKRSYYVTYSFDVEFGEVRQGLMTDTQYEMAKNKAKQLSYDFNYGTTFDKIERAYRWICDNMEYDDTLSKGSAYDALILGDTVCTGYASAFQLIMEQMGIESYLVQGNIDGEGHEWNAVKLDDKYYFVDATFGDTSGQLNKYLLFGTDRRKNETYLDITSKSRYFSFDDIDGENMTDEEALAILMVLGIIMLVFILIIVLIIVLCLNHDKKKKRKMRMMQQNGYYNPYGGPAPGMMGGPYNGNPYRPQGTPYNNPNAGNPYAGNPYGGPQPMRQNPYGSNPNGGGVYNGNPYGSNSNMGGAYGTNPNLNGTYGTNTNTNGAYGANTNTNGAYGANPNLNGVYGTNPNGGGAYGSSYSNSYGSSGAGSQYSGNGADNMGTLNMQGQPVWNPYGSNAATSSDSNIVTQPQEDKTLTAQGDNNNADMADYTNIDNYKNSDNYNNDEDYNNKE